MPPEWVLHEQIMVPKQTAVVHDDPDTFVIAQGRPQKRDAFLIQKDVAELKGKNQCTPQMGIFSVGLAAGNIWFDY